jgi:hypothetical protein
MSVIHEDDENKGIVDEDSQIDKSDLLSDLEEEEEDDDIISELDDF